MSSWISREDALLLALLTENISTLVVIVLLCLATFTDLRRHRIPNFLTFGAAALGLILQVWALSLGGLSVALLGMLVGLLIFLPLYALGGMGAGDVKLIMAAGAFLGPFGALVSGLLSLVAGGIIGIGVLVVRKGFTPFFRRYGATFKLLVATGHFDYEGPAEGEVAAERFPYAAAVAVGVGMTLWLFGLLDRLYWDTYWMSYGF